MSSSRSSLTRSNESIDGTASTNYSPELDRAFGKLKLHDHAEASPGNLASASNEASSSAQGAAAKAPVASGQPVLFTLHPEQAANELEHRQLGTKSFGSTHGGEPLSLFVMVDGQHRAHEYCPSGKVTKILDFSSVVECCFEVKQFGVEHYKTVARFASSHEAEMAIMNLRSEKLDAISISAARYCQVWNMLWSKGVCWTPEHHFDAKLGPRSLEHLGETFVRKFDGQVLIQAAACRGTPGDVEQLKVAAIGVFLDLLTKLPGLDAQVKFSKSHHGPLDNRVFALVVELYKHKSADHLVDFFNLNEGGYHIGGFRFWATHYHEGVLRANGTHLNEIQQGMNYRFLTYQVDDEHATNGAHPVAQRNDMHIHNVQNIYDMRNMHRMQNMQNMHHRVYFDQQYPTTPPRALSNNVDWAAIRDGTDTRTTFMLRNIPSDLTYSGLKDFIDLILMYKYDFLYLRIDYATGKNLGYAFINVAEPRDIIGFYESCLGLRWPVPGTNKKVEVSYATVQNLETLINKFRNSAVMLGSYDARPHLYITESEHPTHKGAERDFPKPDNPQKQMRSEQNAASYGLYPHGRGRGGRFDRGHPNANRNRNRFP